MIDSPEVTQRDAQLTAVIRLTIPRREMQKVMGPAMAEVMAAVTAQGAGPAGPMFSHHFRMSPEIFDFEVGVPVTKPVSPAGRVQPGRAPPMKVVRTVYRGGYEGLGSGWGEFDEWIAGSGHTPAQDLWECYLAGPESSADPADWQTELSRPLIGSPAQATA